MKATRIKCVDLVREIRDDLYLETKGMTKEALVAFSSRPGKSQRKEAKPSRKRKAA